MKKRFNTATVLALMLLVCMSTYLMTRRAAQQSMNANLDVIREMEASNATFLKARSIILDRFIGECDEETLNEGAVRGMVEALGDQWSGYLTAEAYEERQNRNDSFVGIGVTVSVPTDEKPDTLPIIEVYSGSPAEEAGLLPGDEIVAVEDVLVSSLSYVEAVERIQGEEYTVVNITVRRGTTEKIYAIVRRQVIRQMVISEIVEGNIGYIRVKAFDTRVDADFEEAVRRLQEAGVEALLIDVRDNPGGSVDVMSAMLDLLLPKGRLITLEQKDGTQEHRDSNASSVALPMVVLVNENSYSAAEFFAACLSEYEWAKTVGEATTGKGYAQVDIKLPDGSAIHLSVLRYYTPNGVSLAGVGLTPDYPVKQSGDMTDHAADNQFQEALAVLHEWLNEEPEVTEES